MDAFLRFKRSGCVFNVIILLQSRLSNHILYAIQPLSSDEIGIMQQSYLKTFKRQLQPTQETFFKELLLNEESEAQTVFRNRLFLSIAKVFENLRIQELIKI